jgi:hypothetical protein
MYGKQILFAAVLFLGCNPKSLPQSTGLSSQYEKIEGFDATTCTFDKDDPFETRERISKGPNAGLCLDSRKARPLVILNELQAKNYGGSAKDVLTVANVSHLGRFYVAHIPVSKIKAAIFQLEYFPAAVPAGHTQLRMQFEEGSPVTLVSQSKAGNTEVHRVQDLVMSVEALGQPGYKYDIFKGMKDHYSAVYRMTSLDEKYDHMITKQKHRVEQWKLNVNAEEARKIVELYVKGSQENGMREMYHTLERNCTNEIVAAIDAGMKYNLFEKFGRFTAKTTDFYPNVIRISLQKRGLLPRLGKGNDLPELDKDPSILRN